MASTTGDSLSAIVPVSECRTPTRIGGPLGGDHGRRQRAARGGALVASSPPHTSVRQDHRPPSADQRRRDPDGRRRYQVTVAGACARRRVAAISASECCARERAPSSASRSASISPARLVAVLGPLGHGPRDDLACTPAGSDGFDLAGIEDLAAAMGEHHLHDAAGVLVGIGAGQQACNTWRPASRCRCDGRSAATRTARGS